MAFYSYGTLHAYLKLTTERFYEHAPGHGQATMSWFSFNSVTFLIGQ